MSVPDVICVSCPPRLSCSTNAGPGCGAPESVATTLIFLNVLQIFLCHNRVCRYIINFLQIFLSLIYQSKLHCYLKLQIFVGTKLNSCPISTRPCHIRKYFCSLCCFLFVCSSDHQWSFYRVVVSPLAGIRDPASRWANL